MPISTVTSREFNQDTGRVKKAAREGPVLITERGKPAHVLMTFDEYERLRGPKASWLELMGDAAAAEVDDDFERNKDASLRPLDLG